jgi:hypothetical protein
MKDRKLRFFLKAGSSLVFVRTCFFSEPYYQPSVLHQRVDLVFKDFTL